MNSATSLMAMGSLKSRTTAVAPDVPFLPPCLVDGERRQWEQILSAFDRNEYAPKRVLLRSVYDVCQEFPVSGQMLLDVGCGTGLVGAEFARNGAELSGIDILPFAVQRARQRFPTLLADVRRLDGPSGAYDAAICSMVLMLVDELRLALTNIHRIVKSNGLVYFVLLNPFLENSSHCEILDEESKAKWTFNIGCEDISITYIPRTLPEYIRAISEFFAVEYMALLDPSIPRFAAVTETTAQQNAEFLWLIARC